MPLSAFNTHILQLQPDRSVYSFLENAEDALKFHQSLHQYYPTPLHSLPDLANMIGVGNIRVKDESYRFGLNAFKGLGGSYAMFRFIKKLYEKKQNRLFEAPMLWDNTVMASLNLPVFCTATDGNHGRGVAWFAELIGANAVVYMPANTVRSRIEHIKQHGAEVRVIDGTYDDAVELLKSEAEKQGWQIISDTSYPGYYEIPFDIMTGYLTMFEEIRNQSDTYFDFIFLQGGVGAFPASAAAFFSKAFDNKITLVSVEPIAAACLFESIQSDHGQRVEAGGALDSIMAGLNCGLPSEIAWPIIRDRVHLFMAIEDDLARQAMKQFYVPAGNDPHIISGESGSAGLAALLALMTSKELLPVKKALGINTQSRILLVNTEGDTDPDNFQEIVTS